MQTAAIKHIINKRYGSSDSAKAVSKSSPSSTINSSLTTPFSNLPKNLIPHHPFHPLRITPHHSHSISGSQT